ncbi:hypothetical protein ACFLRF_06685 [Candidatus Altiarchaeota archaeon]
MILFEDKMGEAGQRREEMIITAYLTIFTTLIMYVVGGMIPAALAFIIIPIVFKSKGTGFNFKGHVQVTEDGVRFMRSNLVFKWGEISRIKVDCHERPDPSPSSLAVIHGPHVTRTPINIRKDDCGKLVNIFHDHGIITEII